MWEVRYRTVRSASWITWCGPVDAAEARTEAEYVREFVEGAVDVTIVESEE